MAESCKLWGKTEPFYRIRPNEVMIGFNIEDGIVDSIVRNDISIVRNDTSIVRNDISIVRNDTSIVRNDDSIEENEIDDIKIQERILKFMQENPKITANELAKAVDIAPRNVQVHIKSLKTIGSIERVGATKNGHWVAKNYKSNN